MDGRAVAREGVATAGTKSVLATGLRGFPMSQDDLELVTTAELIDELLRRTTFQGVVVHAKEAARTAQWSGERVFSVRHSVNLDTDEAGRLLDVVSQRIHGMS